MMAGDAFTAGVKPGGLNDTTQIRILLCYLIKTAAPLSRDALQDALLQEQLVNYFEMSSALDDLVRHGLATCTEQLYTVTDSGSVVADTLAHDLPRSVRESAVRAVIRAQIWARKEAQNKAEIIQEDGQRFVRCTISDISGEVFRLQLAMPDELTAQAVRRRFVADGSKLYALLLNTLTEPSNPE